MVDNLNTDGVRSRWRDQDLPVSAQFLVWIVVVTGGIVFVHSVLEVLRLSDLSWVYLAVLTAVASAFPVKIPVIRRKGTHFGIAMGDVFIFTSILLFGPEVAALLAATEGAIISLRVGVKSFHKHLFNVLHLALSCYLVGALFYWFEGEFPPMDPGLVSNPAMLLLTIGICGLLYFTMNSGIVALAMSLATRQPFAALWQDFGWASISHFSCASMGAVIFLYFGGNQFYYIALATPVLVLIYYTYRINVDRFTQTQQHLEEVQALLAEKIETEKELQKAKDSLETRVQQRTSELQSTNSQLQREVNDRKAAQRALSEETERLRVTLRSIGDGVVTTDTGGRIVLMNDVSEILTGWTREEAVGHPLADVFQIINQVDGKPCEDLCRTVLETGEIISLDAPGQTIIARDHSQRTISHSAAPIRDDDGQVGGVVLVLRDITDQERLEKELLRAQKLESLGILAGGIAHDFNNILSGILLKTQLAQRALTKERSPAKFLGSIQEAVQTATTLTQQLLTFAKGGSPIKQTASISELLQEASSFALRGSQVSCVLTVDDDLWCAEIDRGQISQVIHNLVINAAQAMPDGGKISVQAENAELSEDDMVELPSGIYIRVKVSDTGTGISADDLSQIFDPYFSTKPTGHGLGLTTTHSIIQKHGGVISVSSKVGVGSCFTFYLPASRADAVILPRAEQQEFDGSGRILIMDDEESIRESLGELLEDMGYQVGYAADGKEALAAYRHAQATGGKFDVVIMDLTIPGGMGGRETIQKLLDLDSQATAVVYSGYSKDPVMAAYRDYGFKARLPKPFKYQQVGELLAHLTGGASELRRVG